MALDFSKYGTPVEDQDDQPDFSKFGTLVEDARRELSPGSTPSTAGAGRGFINPVMPTRAPTKAAPVEADASNIISDDFGGAAIMAQNPDAAIEVNRASSVMTGRTFEKPAPLIDRRGAPVSEDKFNELKKAYDAATPDERETLLKAPGVNGTVFKTIADQYKKLDTSIEKTPTAKVFDTRREARRDSFINQGMEAKSADALAAKEAAQGNTPQPLAQATPSTFDFETKREFARPENKLVQEETGGLITARTIKPSGLDELNAAGKAAYGKVVNQFGSSSAGAWQMIGDLTAAVGEATGNENVGQFGKRLAGGNAILQKEAKQKLEAIGTNPNAALAFVEEGVSGAITNIAPYFVVGPTLALSTMVGQVVTDEYGNGRAAGLKPGEALARATAMGAAEFIGERASLPTPLIKGFKDLVKGLPADQIMPAFAKYLAKENVAEQVTTSLNFATDKWAPFGITPNATLADYLQAVGDTFYQTTAQTLVMGGAGKVAAPVVRKFTEPTTPEGILSKALNEGVAGTEFNPAVNDALARRALDVQSYDANIISPTQTARVGRAQTLLNQATNVDDMTGAAEELAGNLNEMLVPDSAVTPLPVITNEPMLTSELPPLAPGRIEPTMANEPLALTPGPDVNVETEQQFGLDKLRMNAPRPQSIQGKPVASLTDDELSATIADSNVSAITRRSAEVELKARQSEQAPNVPAATTTATEAIPDVTGTLGSTPVRGGAPAPVSELPDANAARADAQRSIDRWSASQGVASPIQFNAAPPEETSAVSQIGQALNSQFGTRLVAYHDTNPDAPNGVAIGGTAFVNTANVAINAGRTSLHEFKHTIEQIAAAEAKAGLTNTPAQQFTTQIDSIFDDMTDEGKRAYVEKFLHKEELDGITDPAAREARIQELVAAPLTRSEMTADFLGNRATDRAFWADVAKADPQGFKGFVDKWLGIIDGLLAKLRGRKDQGKYESARVDKYVQDLNRAKMVARDALVAYRKGTLQQFEGAINGPANNVAAGNQNIPGVAASARPELGEAGRAEVPSYGTGRQGAISVVGRHYSSSPQQSLSGAYYGRGLKGAERNRLDSSTDPRLKNRIYFYVDQGSGIRPESGVGGYAHEVKLDNIYDPQTGLVRPQADLNGFESAVINAGFDGYIAPFGNNQAAVVLLGQKHKAVPVAQIGQPASAPLPQAAAPTTLKKGLLSREANTIDVSKIPGAKLRMGSLEIPAEQTEAANAELERIGSDVRFAKKQQAEIAGPPVPKDFGVYKDVAKSFKLSDAEYNASALPLMTGQAGDRAFQTPRVGGLPEVVQWLDNRRQESGLPLLNIKSENDRETLANMMAAEAVAAIKSAGNAVEWYDETVAKTLRIMAVKYPELESDPAARNAFLMAVAISSQTMNVEDNLRYASKQYEAYRASVDAQGVGRFPEVGTGKSAPAMGNNFALANDVLAEMGPDLLRRFLQTEFTKRDLETMGFPIGGESMDEKMLGSAIFGPKIGFGFYSNLTGNFEPVTMDMWFMRTIGRLAGTLPAFDEKLFPKQVAKLRAALQQTGDANKGLYAASFDPALVAEAMKTDEGAVALARQVNSLHNRQYINERAKFDAGTRIKTDLVGAAASILKSADKPKDAPKSGGERQLLRDVVRRMVDKVEKETGKRVPPAALQALIWYPEQELYKKLGVKLRVTSQDYAGAAKSLLTKEGFDGKRISTAAKSGPGPARQVAGKQVAGANQPTGQPSRPSGPLGGTERKTFIEERTTRVRSEEVRAQPLEDIFANLNKRGLARTKAEVAYTARPDGAQIKYVQENFLDILSELEDSDLVKINCD